MAFLFVVQLWQKGYGVASVIVVIGNHEVIKTPFTHTHVADIVQNR